MPGHILAIAPHYGFSTTGGLQLALRDLFNGLRARGWTFDILTPVGTMPAPDARRVLSAAHQRRAIGRVQRYPAIRNVWQSAAVPRVARDFVRALGHDPNADRAWSHDLGVIAESLRHRRHDLVLAVAWPPAPPGMLALVTALSTPVVAVSLEGLGEELRNPFWPLARRRAERLLGKAIAPMLWRRVDPRALKTVVFASDAWRAEAIAGGLPDAVARTISFGVPSRPPLPRAAPGANRLLWVGRLAPEKGLHRLLPAIRRLRERIPTTTLTVIASVDVPWYSVSIERQIADLGVEDIVDLRGPVPRDTLPEWYASHDALLHFSQYAESVALTIMEAHQARLPVIANAPRVPSLLVREGRTAWTYPRETPDHVAAAVLRARHAPDRAAAMADRARALVESAFTNDVIVAAYDRLLRRVARH